MEMVLVNERNLKRNFICKNDLIDATKRFSTLQLNIFYNLLYLIKEQRAYDTEFSEYDPDFIGYQQDFGKTEASFVTFEKLEQRLGCKKHLTKEELINVISELPKGIYSKDGKSDIEVFSFIKYDEKWNEVKVKITEDFEPYLYDIAKEFTVLELKGLSSLGSTYAQRMFEFGSKHRNLPTYLMPIGDFKKYFKVPATYNMGNIDSRILKPSLIAVNAVAQFKMKATKIKSKNRVTHIKFVLNKLLESMS